MTFFMSCKHFKKNNATTKKNVFPNQIIAKLPGQNPEGIEFDVNRNLFFLSAINKTPSIATVDLEGNVSIFSKDNGFYANKTFGLQINYNNNNLLACSNNTNSSNLDIYNLTSGLLEHRINLSHLLNKSSLFQANDLIVDDTNTIYVTGRLENTIYKIDSNLKPSVFFQNKDFNHPNGIVYHPDGYLIVAYYTKDEAHLVKIPTKTPHEAESIPIEGLNFRGFDGMILNDKGHLVGVAKNFDRLDEGFVFELQSKDHWKTATVINKAPVKRSTTIALINSNEYYVLNQNWKNRDAKNWVLEKVNLNKKEVD